MSALSTVTPPLPSTEASTSFQLLAESSKPGAAERALYERQIQEVEAWWKTERFEAVKRPYSAADVVSKRGTLMQTYASSVMARKLWNLVKEREREGKPIHTSMLLRAPQASNQGAWADQRQ